jgi:hypothetical protein
MTILQVRAPAEQKSQPLTHESSSVGARPSSAAPVEQNPQMGLSLPLNGVRKEWVLFDGGGRGRTRSGRRAFVC